APAARRSSSSIRATAIPRSGMSKPSRAAPPSPATKTALARSAPGWRRRRRRSRPLRQRQLFRLVLVAAEIAHHAGRAQRPSRHAGVAAVQDQPMMSVQLVFLRHLLLETEFDRENGLARSQIGAIADSEDMGVDRDGRLSERDVENDIGGLAPGPG